MLFQMPQINLNLFKKVSSAVALIFIILPLNGISIKQVSKFLIMFKKKKLTNYSKIFEEKKQVFWILTLEKSRSVWHLEKFADFQAFNNFFKGVACITMQVIDIFFSVLWVVFWLTSIKSWPHVFLYSFLILRHPWTQFSENGYFRKIKILKKDRKEKKKENKTIKLYKNSKSLDLEDYSEDKDLNLSLVSLYITVEGILFNRYFRELSYTVFSYLFYSVCQWFWESVLKPSFLKTNEYCWF